MSQISRKLTRKLLFQKLFSLTYLPIEDKTFLDSFYFDDNNNQIDEKYFSEMQNIISKNEPIFIAIIEKYAPKFDIKSMNPIIILPIFIALAEMLYFKEEIPGLVSVNEAIEIAKTYGDASTKKIVNGILHNVLSDYNEITKNLDKLTPKTDYSFLIQINMVLRKLILENEEIIANITQLLNELQIPFKNIDPYIIAFVHRSIVNEKPDFTTEHNERLEFLGDAVLELVVTANLYRDFPKTQEGELTDIRSAIVRGRNLAVIAKKLGLSKYLQLGHGEEMGGGRESEYLQANAFEAFVGAMFLDLGFDFVKTFVDKYVYSTLDEIMKTHKLKDYKSLIQEYTQAKFNQTPTYEVLSETGPDHNKMFEVGIYLGEEMIGKGSGTSKKKAQENAAENAYISVKK